MASIYRFQRRVKASANQVIVFSAVYFRSKQKVELTALSPILVIPEFSAVQSSHLQAERGTKKMGDLFWSDKGPTTA